MEKACTSLFGSVPLWFSPGKREPNRKFRVRGSEGSQFAFDSLKIVFFFFNRIFADFFPPFTFTCNFVKSSHQSRFPVLVLSIWFWPKLQTNPPAQV